VSGEPSAFVDGGVQLHGIEPLPVVVAGHVSVNVRVADWLPMSCEPLDAFGPFQPLAVGLEVAAGAAHGHPDHVSVGRHVCPVAHELRLVENVCADASNASNSKPAMIARIKLLYVN
jgi:hypothetical protein